MSNLEMHLKREMGMEPDYTGAAPRPSFANGFAVGATELTEARLRSFGRLIEAKTTAGTDFGGTGANVEAILNQGSITIPANTLSAGDVVKVRVGVAIPTTISSDTLALSLRVGGLTGTVIATMPATNVSDNDLVTFDADIVIRTSTTGYAAASLVGTTGGTPGAGAKLTALSGLDLTAAIVLAVTGVWSTELGNKANLHFFSAVVYGG